MLKDIQAVIFDLDGSLVDSMWIWKDIDIEYLGRFGIPLPENLQAEIEGMSFSETAVFFKERFGIPDDLDVIKAEWNRMACDKYRYEVPYKAGARAFLAFCSAELVLFVRNNQKTPANFLWRNIFLLEKSIAKCTEILYNY